MPATCPLTLKELFVRTVTPLCCEAPLRNLQQSYHRLCYHSRLQRGMPIARAAAIAAAPARNGRGRLWQPPQLCNVQLVWYSRVRRNTLQQPKQTRLGNAARLLEPSGANPRSKAKRWCGCCCGGGRGRAFCCIDHLARLLLHVRYRCFWRISVC